MRRDRDFLVRTAFFAAEKIAALRHEFEQLGDEMHEEQRAMLLRAMAALESRNARLVQAMPRARHDH